MSPEELQRAAVLARTTGAAAYSRSGTDVQRDLQARAKDLEKTIMRQAIQGAAFNAGFQLAIGFIPGIGQSLAAVAGLVNLIGGKRYEDKLKNHYKNKTNELKQFQASKQKELNNALSASYKASYASGIKMAQSWQPLTSEYEGQSFEDVFQRDIEEPDKIEGLIDKVTGRDAYTTARNKIDDMVDDAKRTIRETVNPIIAQVKSSGFRALMAKEIALKIREVSHPALAAAFKDVSPSSYTNDVQGSGVPADPQAITPADAPSTTPLRVAAIGTAALGLALFLLR